MLEKYRFISVTVAKTALPTDTRNEVDETPGIKIVGPPFTVSLLTS